MIHQEACIVKEDALRREKYITVRCSWAKGSNLISQGKKNHKE